MFRRRHPIPLWRRLRGWLWPHIGWRRLGIYLVKRLTRLPGTPHSIAAGFACGTAISFTPFLGLHTLLSVLLSFLLRGNYLAAVAGTLVGNPWTFPVIWVMTYHFGHFLLGSAPSEIPPLEEPELTSRWHELKDLILPMTVGGVPLGVLAGLLVYFPVARMIAAYQEARRRRRQRRQAERRGKLGITDPSASPGAGVR
jgi:uncharacterized protein (DUF2062 family)